MLEIQHLDWDTQFFGYPIGKIVLPSNTLIQNEPLLQNDYKLIYLFSEKELEKNSCKALGVKLVDIKIEFVKNPSQEINTIKETNQIEIKQIKTLSEVLMHLVLESGVYSRFKLDKNFVHNEYERLYRAWIEKSLNDNDGAVFGAYINNELLGFISLSLKASIADIGLIAVNEKARGMHIGKRLIEEAYQYANLHQSNSLTVVTQENNSQAMHFYRKNGFEIEKKTYIYHLWKIKQ